MTESRTNAPDVMTVAAAHQKNVMAIADFVSRSEANNTLIDNLIKEKALPALIDFSTKTGGDNRYGWGSTREYLKFGDDIMFRASANYAGIWWNSSLEVVYYMGMMDEDFKPLHGDNTYVIHYKPEDLPMKHVNAYWSLTLLSLPDYRVVPNKLEQYNLNNISKLQYEADGSLKIYLASELPANAPESNWLPSPKENNFTVNNRLYVPKKEVLSGEWYVPPIQKQKKTSKLTTDKAKAITEEAYIFAYPMLMAYRGLYYGYLNEKSPVYRAPANQMVHDAKPADHTRIDVVTMNGDTPYSLFMVDLRTEPVVVSVPEIKDRYYVIQFPDFYTHNFAFIGTRATGTEAGDYLFVGPKWKGKIPEGKFKKIFHCETELTAGVGRTQLFGLDDLPNVLAIQKGYGIAGLSEFMGEEPKTIPDTNWPVWKEEVLSSIEFIDYFNFGLTFCEPIHPDDMEAMARFARIGVKPGAAFDKSAYSEDVIKAIEEGIAEATKKIQHKAENIAEQKNGWHMMEAFGPREFFKGDWLLRAGAGMAAIFANDKIEAFYPMVYVDGNGEVLNSKTDKYTLHFTKDEIPPAKYFWSVTMYDKRGDGIAGYMIENPINRYLISSTTEGLLYDKDGGLTIYIQHAQPEGEKAANWLPAPAEPFYMCMRIYGPEERVMNNEWAPPAVQKVK